MVCAKFGRLKILNLCKIWLSGSGEDYFADAPVFCAISLLFNISLRKGCNPPFDKKKNEPPSHQDCFVPSLTEIGPVFLEHF